MLRNLIREYSNVSTSVQLMSSVECEPAPRCLEWPSPHDCTSSVWDELKFIPIIGSATGIEVGSILFFFSHLLQGYPLKKIILLPKHFKPQLPTSAPSKTLNLVVIQEQKQCCRRRCYKSNVEMLLQKTMLHRSVEAML